MGVRKAEDGAFSGGFVIQLVLLWLSGLGLRLTVLAVPPVIPLIHRDLHLSQTGVGMLTALPSLLFAAAAVPGSLLISRFGSVPTLVAGLLMTAVSAALRGAASEAMFLFGTTFLMGAGISVMQPALPRVVRDWLPHRIGFGTAVYANGLLVGELLSVSFSFEGHPGRMEAVGERRRPRQPLADPCARSRAEPDPDGDVAGDGDAAQKVVDRSGFAEECRKLWVLSRKMSRKSKK